MSIRVECLQRELHGRRDEDDDDEEPVEDEPRDEGPEEPSEPEPEPDVGPEDRANRRDRRRGTTESIQISEPSGNACRQISGGNHRSKS